MMMMSDGALSKAEIDALLSGVDSSLGAGGSATATAAPPSNGGGSISPEQKKALETFLTSTTDAQSSNLSMLTGTQIHVKGPQVTINGRDLFLGQLSEKVVVIKSDFSSGFPGEHMFILPEDGAKAIASLINKEDNIQLDEMSMSVLSEAVSQIVGHQITALTGKTGNKSIAAASPEATNVPKAVVALPSGDFAGATYQLDLGDGKTCQLWEVLGPSVASDIAKSLNSGGGAAAQQAKGPAVAPQGLSGGSNMGGGSQMGGSYGGGMQFGNPNVQSVQFPHLAPHGGPQEAGNIGLIMDVYMEMTVELGRTKKLIKEILNMGEGTIIELDKLAGEPVDILVNHKLIAKGEVVVIDENFGVRVTEIVSPAERMSDLG
jgi:flagellar motor switch protein FliN/FliY